MDFDKDPSPALPRLREDATSPTRGEVIHTRINEGLPLPLWERSRPREGGEGRVRGLIIPLVEKNGRGTPCCL